MCVARRAADAADAFGVIVLQFWSIALSKVGSLLYRFVGYESTNIHHPGRDCIVPRIENFGIATWCHECHHVVVGSSDRRLCCADVIPKTCVYEGGAAGQAGRESSGDSIHSHKH